MSKMLIAGAFRMKGEEGKKSGLPYEFAQVLVLVPIEQVKNASFEKNGYGYSQSVLGCDAQALAAFAPFQGKFPLYLELDVEVVSFMGEFRPVVVGVKPAAAAVAPAPAAKVA